MSTSPEEQKDLDAMKAAQDQIYRNGFMALRHRLELDETMLKHTGHKSVEAAVTSTVKYYMNQADALLKAHLKKYPD